jgi:predicted nucleic acid-binding protein
MTEEFPFRYVPPVDPTIGPPTQPGRPWADFRGRDRPRSEKAHAREATLVHRLAQKQTNADGAATVTVTHPLGGRWRQSCWRTQWTWIAASTVAPAKYVIALVTDGMKQGIKSIGKGMQPGHPAGAATTHRTEQNGAGPLSENPMTSSAVSGSCSAATTPWRRTGSALARRPSSRVAPMEWLQLRLALSPPELDALWLLACIELDPALARLAQVFGVADCPDLIEWKQAWGDLVLPETQREQVDELIARVRHRREVLEVQGFGDKTTKGHGQIALLSGEPGTGKTMLAGLIAAELGLDLYQVDLSNVVSRYIGETEKGLAKLFDAAESGHIVLLFDEADALFARRSEVKSANDRCANLETNYLLQRLESFAGISILTTNHDAALDDAFRRRLACHIKFPLPDEAERAKLWQALIPRQARIARDINVGRLARDFDMSGGHIKNAVMRAAYLAAARDVPISMEHLRKAAHAEYEAMGRILNSSARL